MDDINGGAGRRPGAAAWPAAERVVETLAAHPGASVAELAAASGLGQSTVGKALVALAAGGAAVRRSGGRDGGRRLPDRWHSSAATVDVDGTASPTGRTGRGDADGGTSGRLASGQLREIVATLLGECTEPVTATRLAKAAGGRSSGAVGNCLERLVKAGVAVRVSDHPKAYLPAVLAAGHAAL